MKTFINFLLEFKGAKNEATLVFHQILSMLDNSHVDMTETSIRFNVGAVIKRSMYNNLCVLIRAGSNTAARIASHKTDGKIYIVLETGKLPTREGIAKYLENHSIAKPFISAFDKYLANVHQDPENAHKTKDEIEGVVNTDDKFEELYGKVVTAVDKAITDYQKANKETDNLFKTYNINKQETGKMTLSLLKKETFGETELEFAKKFMSSVPEIEHLNKDLKKKMESRLKSLFVDKVSTIK